MPFCVAFAPLFPKGNLPFSGTGNLPASLGSPTIRKGRTWAVAVRRASYKSLFLPNSGRFPYPEGPARQIDVSRQKLSPHCLEAIFDSQLPSPELSPKMPPKLSLPHKRGLFVLFQN